MILIGGNVVSPGVGTKSASGKKVVVGSSVPKPQLPGLGVPNPLFSTNNLGRFNPCLWLKAVAKLLFSVKGFSAQAFAAIPKLGQREKEVVDMEGELARHSLTPLNGSRRSATMLLNQPRKKAKMVESLDSSKGLELVVVPHLALVYVVAIIS